MLRIMATLLRSETGHWGLGRGDGWLVRKASRAWDVM